MFFLPYYLTKKRSAIQGSAGKNKILSTERHEKRLGKRQGGAVTFPLAARSRSVKNRSGC